MSKMMKIFGLLILLSVCSASLAALESVPNTSDDEPNKQEVQKNTCENKKTDVMGEFERVECSTLTRNEMDNLIFFEIRPSTYERLTWTETFKTNFSNIIANHVLAKNCKNMLNRDKFSVSPSQLIYITPSPLVQRNSTFAIFYIKELIIKTNKTDIIPKTLVLDCLEEVKEILATQLGNVTIIRIKGTFPYKFDRFCKESILVTESVVNESTVYYIIISFSIVTIILIGALVLIIKFFKVLNFDLKPKVQMQTTGIDNPAHELNNELNRVTQDQETDLFSLRLFN